MKFFSPFLLLLCVSMLCITSTAGSYNLKTASLGLPQPHSIHKRQLESDACSTATVTSICTSGYYEDYAYVAALCNQTSYATSLQDACRRNSKGDICGNFDFDRNTVMNACGGSTTACTSECREFVSTSRARLGCCINFNNSIDYPDLVDAFSYSLLSLCGEEPVTEQCAPSTWKLPVVDSTCTLDRAFELIYSRVLCRTEYLDSLRNSLEAVGNCEDDFDITSLCVVNEDDNYCEAIRDTDLDGLFLAASSNCQNTSVCDPLCVGNLTTYIIPAGCCFMEQYNVTKFAPRHWLSYDFWQRCGLTSPGLCARKFDDSNNRISDASTLKAPGKTISFAVALFMIFFALD